MSALGTSVPLNLRPLTSQNLIDPARFDVPVASNDRNVAQLEFDVFERVLLLARLASSSVAPGFLPSPRPPRANGLGGGLIDPGIGQGLRPPLGTPAWSQAFRRATCGADLGGLFQQLSMLRDALLGACSLQLPNISQIPQSFCQPQKPQKVYVFGNRDYPLSTAKSAKKEVDLSKTMAQEFGGDIFNKLNAEARQVSDRYGEMFGKSVVFGENGQLIGIYDTKEMEKLNADFQLYGHGTGKGKNLKTPDGQTFEIADNHYASPLTFDLNGEGKVGTTDMAHGRHFRMAADGTETAWAETGDGILAFGEGKDGSELLGNNAVIDGRQYANGFDALGALATKYLGPDRVQKGYLDKQDLLELEQKANLHMIVAGDTATEDKNARPVEDLGIEQISLGYSEAGENADANGNQHREVGAGFVQRGQKKAVDDVWYQYA